MTRRNELARSKGYKNYYDYRKAQTQSPKPKPKPKTPQTKNSRGGNYTFTRRNELAKEKGFKSYSAYRKAYETANKDHNTLAVLRHKYGPKAKFGGATNFDAEFLKLYYEAFYASDQNDYTIHKDKKGNLLVEYDASGRPTGAKAKFLIEYMNYVDDYDDWTDLYPLGIR